MADLNWTASADKDWIIINPSQGSGTQQVSVTVIPATSFGDKTLGTITVECGGNKKYITVKRCAPEGNCSCDLLTVSTQQLAWDYNENDNKSFTIGYDETCIINISSSIGGENSDKFVFNSSTNTVKPIGQNNTSTPYKALITVSGKTNATNPETCNKTITLIQNGSQCTCESLQIVPNYATDCIDGASHRGEIIATYTGNCGKFTSLSSDKDWITNVGAGNTLIKADISQNCGEVTREATITIEYEAPTGSACERKTFKVKQCGIKYTISETEDSCNHNCSGGTVTFGVSH